MSPTTLIQWILDSGASSHIACSSSLFSSFTSHAPFFTFHPPSFVTLPNNSQALVHAIGTVTLSNSLVLHDVLYIPDFHVNLISIPALLKQSPILAKFTASSCCLQDSNSLKEIGKSELDVGLYVLRQVSSPPSIVDFNKVYATQSVSLYTWHARLGHLSDKIVSNNHMSKNLFDLVHCDI